MTEKNLVIKSSLPVKTLKTVIENSLIKNITPRIPIGDTRGYVRSRRAFPDPRTTNRLLISIHSTC